jgi:flagellar basal-body rod protein FlgB
LRPIHLFDITAQHNRWLAAREAVLAGNIANANTPGYKAQDLTPFEQVLETTGLEMSTTAPGHMVPDSATGASSPDRSRGSTWDVVHSGNSVSMENELMKAGEVNGAFSMNVGVMKAFERMLTTASRSS